jgi:hypothetical protein
MRLRGIIQSGPVNVGSKSEHVGYWITRGDGMQVLLYRIGDNPFVNPSLKPFEGQEVEIAGELDGDLFLVKEIRRRS